MLYVRSDISPFREAVAELASLAEGIDTADRRHIKESLDCLSDGSFYDFVNHTSSGGEDVTVTVEVKPSQLFAEVLAALRERDVEQAKAALKGAVSWTA